MQDPLCKSCGCVLADCLWLKILENIINFNWKLDHYYEGCSNMNASGFITFFTNMLRQNGKCWAPPPGVLGIWGEWLFIFRDLGSTGNYFRGSGEQAHSFGDLGSPAKKQKNKGKASILFDFLKFLMLLGG